MFRELDYIYTYFRDVSGRALFVKTLTTILA